MKFNYYPLAFILLLFSSCSLNKAFLRAVPLSTDLSEGTMRDWANNTMIRFKIGRDFQPTFFTLQNDTLKKPYTIESVVFASASGNKLNGWILKPRAKYNGVSILFLHGKGGNIFNQYQRLVPLVLQGFNVLVFDYSGFGFSEGKATRKNILADANSAFDYLVSRNDLNTKHFFIYGQSLGGHLAAVVAAANQHKVEGLVIEGAFSSHKDMAAYKSKLGFIARALTKEIYSATGSIGKYKKPLLVIHSNQDDVVPLSMGKKIFNCAHEPKTFLEIEKCHVCGPFYYDELIRDKILGMLKVKEY